MRRNIRLAAVAATLLVLLLTACSGDDALEPAATTAAASAGDEGFGVGVVSEELIDDSRETPASQGQPATDERALDTVIWYPTQRDPAPGAEGNAEPASAQGPFPLIVFSHGYGGSPANIEDIADDWVRAGFVVAAPNFPLSRADHRGGPDATDVENQAGDVSFLISALTDDLDADSPLAGLVDGERIGAAGHSLGAITTLGATMNTCCADDRIDAVIEMSGTFVAFRGGEYDLSLAPPLLIVHGTDDELVDYADALTVFERVETPKGLLTIEDGTHDSWLEAQGDGHDDVARVTTDFFLAYLADDADALERLETEQTASRTVTLQFDFASETTRRAVATPTTGLTAGQPVTVTWSGFTPGGTINVVQCSQGGKADGSDCALPAGYLMRADPTGSGTVELSAIVGVVGSGRCEAGATDCVILVNDSGLTDPGATILIPIDFAR